MNFYFDIEISAHCPIRGFLVSADTKFLYGVDFVLRENQAIAEMVEPTAVHCDARRQIEAYLRGRLKDFDLPLSPGGTPFQQQVWAEIARIPFGETITYGEIALRLGDANRARAVGQAAHTNPLPLVIPCHRVVGWGGRLTGFAAGIATKAFLLAHERRGNLLW